MPELVVARASDQDACVTCCRSPFCFHGAKVPEEEAEAQDFAYIMQLMPKPTQSHHLDMWMKS